MSKLAKGDKCPDFSLKNQDDKIVSLGDFKGKKLLIYFYPKAMTSGCTTQSCSLRDIENELEELNVYIVGISPDSVERQKKFDEKNSLGFDLLSDEDHKVADAFAVWGEKSMYGKKYFGIIRSVFLIDEEGQVLEARYKISPKKTVPTLLKVLK